MFAERISHSTHGYLAGCRHTAVIMHIAVWQSLYIYTIRWELASLGVESGMSMVCKNIYIYI